MNIQKTKMDIIRPYQGEEEIFTILPSDEKREAIAARVKEQYCTLTKTGKIYKGNANLERIMENDPYLQGICKLDTATRKMCFSDFYIESYELDLRISEHFSKGYDCNITTNKAKDLRASIAYKNKFNSILVNLDKFPIPEKNPLSDLLTHITFNNCNDEIVFQIFDLFFKKLAIKLLSVEIKWLHYVNDIILIFEGKQGVGKSLLCKLIGLDSMNYFIDLGDVPKGDLTNKDVKMQIRGKIIAEIGELSGLRKTVTESLKAFLSQPFDEYRLPYAAEVSTIPRTASFIGTTNEPEFLSDPTGNRRFFPLMILKVEWSLFQEHELVEAIYGYYLNWGREILNGSRAEIQKKLFKLNTYTPELELYLDQVRAEKRVRSRYESFLDDYIRLVKAGNYFKLGRGEKGHFEYYNAGEAGKQIFNNDASKIPNDFSKAFIARMREEKMIPYGKNGQKKIDGQNLRIWVPE